MQNRNVTTIILFLSLLVAHLSAASKKEGVQEILTQTHQGMLRGKVEQNICVWRGIRYAVADRFSVPHASAGWSGVKDALAFGPVAPQLESLTGSSEAQSEDCLFLNVWSPAADNKRRPVMVWIHGGSFLEGSGSLAMYNGLKLAKQGDVVVVSINYRLGPFGFLYYKNASSTKDAFANNLGIRDQIAALQWVKENIAAFGGDSTQVTIFGESAGGTSVETLLACRAARGLFKGAIAQSGPPSVMWQPAVAERITQKYFSFLRLSSDSLYLLKTLPLDTLMEAQKKLVKYMREETDEKVFAPTVDGELLTTDIFKSMSPEANGDVALMLGTNKDESTLFVKTMKTAPSNAKELEEFINRKAPGRINQITAGYEKYPKKRAVFDILTDAVFRVPAIRLAEERCTYSTVYMYRFEWTSAFLNMMGLRSFHALEIPFVFGNTDKKTSRIIRTVFTQKIIDRISGQMLQAWVNFARYGNPNGKNSSAWKPYTLNDRQTQIFNKVTRLQADPDSKQRKAWVGVEYY